MNISVWFYEINEILKHFTGGLENDPYSSGIIISLMILPFLMMSWVLGTSLFESLGGTLRVMLGAAIPLGVGLIAYIGCIIYLEHRFESEEMFHWAQGGITVIAFLLSILLIGKPLLGLGFFKTLCTLAVMAISAYGGYHLGIRLLEQGPAISKQVFEEMHEIEPLKER